MRAKFDNGEDPMDPEEQAGGGWHQGFNPFGHGGGGFNFKFHFNWNDATPSPIITISPCHTFINGLFSSMVQVGPFHSEREECSWSPGLMFLFFPLPFSLLGDLWQHILIVLIMHLSLENRENFD